MSLPNFITITVKGKRLLKPLIPPVYPPTPPGQGYPAWAAVKENRTEFLRKLQEVFLSVYPQSSNKHEDNPSWKRAEEIKRSFNIKLQKVLELNIYPSSPVDTPEEYPSWRGYADTEIRSKFVRTLQTVLHPVKYRIPLGGVGALLPHFLTKYSRRRKVLEVLDFVLAGVVAPPELSSEDYPSWLEPKSFSTDFLISRVPLYEAYSAPGEPPPSFAFDLAVLQFNDRIRKFERRHLTLPDLLERPATVAFSSHAFPSWQEIKSFRREFKTNRLRLELNKYPPDPTVREAFGYPGWLNTEILTRSFNIKNLGFPGIDEWRVTPPSVTGLYPAHILSGHFRTGANRFILPPLPLDTYPDYVGDLLNVAEYFPTGQLDVVITVYNPITGAVVALDNNQCVEIPGTGVYLWDITKITTQSIPYKEFPYKMTDGSNTSSGMVPYDNFLIQYIIHEEMDLA